MNSKPIPHSNMSDEELDRDWKPSGRRPQSTIARSFSQELMDIFRIENSVADLDEQIDKRKHQVSTQAHELEALEARIREMEQRLKGQAAPRAGQPAQRASPGASPRHARAPIGNTFGEQAPPPVEKDFPPRTDSRGQGHSHRHAAAHDKYGGSRPGTARASQQAVPGALPPTPVASEDGDGEHEA